MYPRGEAIQNIAIRGFPDTSGIRPGVLMHQRRMTDPANLAAQKQNRCVLMSRHLTSYLWLTENTMKASMMALAFAAFATTGIAHAADSAALNGAVSNVAQTQQNSVTPKTRAEVRHELALAEKDGELARLQSLYHGN
jgi:cbb3-type cytochrome oxidase cytochrome c subunit